MSEEKFLVISEFGDAMANVVFEEGQGVKFEITPYHLSQIKDWSRFDRIVSSVELWEKQLRYVADKCSGHNWAIVVEAYSFNGNGVLFECYGNEGITIDLGTLAECYENCDECTICHNIDTMYYDDQLECCRDCEGCQEHPCVKVNGRERLEYCLKYPTELL